MERSGRRPSCDEIDEIDEVIELIENTVDRMDCVSEIPEERVGERGLRGLRVEDDVEMVEQRFDDRADADEYTESCLEEARVETDSAQDVRVGLNEGL